MSDNKMRDAALEYAQAGYAVFPIKARGKTPLIKEWQKRATTDKNKISSWWDKWPQANIAIACGQISRGLIVIDVDKKSGGLETVADWERENGTLTSCQRSITGSGGFHYFYTSRISDQYTNKAGVYQGVDLRTDGGYIIAPPSLHPGGGVYQWEMDAITDNSPIELSGTAEQFIEPALKDFDDGMPAPHYEFPAEIVEGQRNSELYKAACSLLGRGLSETAARAALNAENLEKCSPPLDDAEIEQLFNSAVAFINSDRSRSAGADLSRAALASGLKPSADKSPLDYSDIELVYVLNGMKVSTDRRYNSLSDIAAGALFSSIYGKYLRYNTTARGWYWYNGINWQRDRTERAEKAAETLSNALYHYAVGQGDAYQKLAGRLQDINKRDKMLRDAQKHNPITSEMLDQKPDLFNCKCGTYNLKTRKWKDHDPADLLSKCANVTERDCQYTDFEKVVTQILPDKEIRDYFQMVIGLCLSEDTTPAEFYIILGETTRNGKSTLLNAIGAMMGDYHLTIAPETLEKANRVNSSGPSPDRSRFQGARMIHAEEPRRGMPLDSAFIKAITGGDTMTARQLHQEPVSFRVVGKLVIVTNHLPAVSDTTVFSSERVAVIPFEQRFIGTKRDYHLQERMRKQEMLNQCFSWACEGNQKYRNAKDFKTNRPAAITKRVDQYQADSDYIGQFIKDCIKKDPEGCIRSQECYHAYKYWCEENNCKPFGPRAFNSELRGPQRGHLLKDSATVDGKTVRNVIPGYSLKDSTG